MLNTEFPKWLTANAILKHIAHKYLGVYVELNEKYCSVINISFIPLNEVIAMVPPEDKTRFLVLNDKFTRWAAEALKISNIFDKYIHQPNDVRTRASLVGDVKTEILKYNENNLMNFEDQYLNIMGVSGGDGCANIKYVFGNTY